MRPHIEFIQSQWLPWAAGVVSEARPNVPARVLSRDSANGACSLILQYPPGWQQTAQTLNADEEFIVLSGELCMDAARYGKHCYAHWPAGFRRGALRSDNGAEVLTFFSQHPHPTAPSTAHHDPARLVLRLDTRAMPGHIGPRAHMNSSGFQYGGTVHKLLFADPLTNDKTWLAGLAPDWRCDTVEVHPVAEEEFALAGDIHMPNGVMLEGAYFWRPPGIPHGPFGTVGGTLHLCRGKGGLYSTRFEAATEPFAWDRPFRPILPSDYRGYLPL
jgi:hypothetical protein